jgi:predicted amidohydrolase
MQIAVIQHVLRGDDQLDAVALGNAAADATDMGAEVIVFPRVSVLSDSSEGDPVVKLFEAIGEAQSENTIYINPGVMPDGVHFATLPALGSAVLMVGDACADAQEILAAAGKKPSVAILVPGSESDLQAEAVAELALGLSSSLAGLILIAETNGAEPGDAGHGGSAIVHLGEVVAEAMGDGDETLVGEFELPIAQPEPRGLLPQVPTILSARLAHHQGHTPDVDYPAELS